MARSRNIKPGFFSNEDLVELDFATRLLFAGLWTVADREGRLQDRPKKIKIDIFPADNLDIDAMLQSLHNGGFIERYAVEEAKYIQICNWNKHQNPHHTEKPSEIPGKAGCLTVKDALDARQSQKQDGGNLADSLLLIPDSLIPDSLNKKTPPAKRADPVAKPDDVDEQVWNDWLQLRKTKKAAVTQTVLRGAKEQAQIAGMTLEEFLRVWCRRGSQGLEAAWLKPDEKRRQSDQSEPLWRTEQRERTLQAVPGIAAKSQNFIDVEAQNVITPSLG